MSARRLILLALAFVAGFALAYLTRKSPPRQPAPEPPTISTIYARCPGDAPGVLHKFSTDTPANPGAVAAWWVGPDGKTVTAGFVLTMTDPTR